MNCPALLLSLLLSAAGVAQQDGKQVPKQDPPTDPQKVLEELQQKFKAEGIRLDPKAQTVTIDAVVNQSPDPIEYLLIHRRGKRHEAVFVTNSKPSLLNAALLMIGLQQGKNARIVEKDPQPTLEEVQKGVDPVIVLPAEGTPFWMTVRWKTPEGKEVEHCVEDLLLELSTQEPVRSCTWVYLGGRLAKLYKDEPEVYVADYEGNLISTCYMSPDNHLATMVHPNARDDHNWWTTDLLPAPGTAVEFIFHRTEPQMHIDREKRLKMEDEAAAKAKAAAAKEEAAKAAGNGDQPDKKK